ncbi:hypothetical protein IAR55_002124 [Kwoniella newhampshirensis]|uniref:S-adenosyl-L-methionine-dependent methyltransferase n=1 Tax=Kwoniella newhampshirensis TaxID=1651941 RepID=A0AAW0YQ25_9TREE
MPSLTLLSVSVVPLILLLAPRWIEPYSLLDYEVLNVRPGDRGRTTAWFNMGWWENTDIFPDAAEALAQKMLDLAYEGGYVGGGSVLDIGHGAGESLALHLSQPSPPRHLHALTSLSSDTSASRKLIEALYPVADRETEVGFFTFSARFRPGKDVGHPLDRMRGYLGENGAAKDRSSSFVEDEWDSEEQDQLVEEDESEGIAPDEKGGIDAPPPYDLIYILDSVYHYPPSLPEFLSTTQPVLSPSGLVVFTDIVPPPSLPRWNAFIISYILNVPFTNLFNRPDLQGYKAQLEGEGWEDVVVQDWSEGVWPGFITDLKSRGGFWYLVGRVVEGAQKEGWKFVGVRVKRGKSCETMHDD